MVSSKLGLSVSLVSAVGGDFIGSDYESILIDYDVDISSMIRIEDDKTPTAFVLTDSTQDQISYFYWGAASKFKKSKPPEETIMNVKSVHLATGDPEFNWKCGKVAQDEGKIISFDPGQDLHMYSSQELKNVIKICDILFGNHHEIDRILNILNMDIEEMQNYGPSIVVKTLGKDGSIIYSKEEIKIDPLYRKPYDPTGAGDSYRAGFMKSYLTGNSLESCGRFASAVASFIVEAEGCQTNIPDEFMVKERMEKEGGFDKKFKNF
jgi:sugar/nucleoside kinase (ribokinase family)